jgi:hypothetical protein
MTEDNPKNNTDTEGTPNNNTETVDTTPRTEVNVSTVSARQLAANRENAKKCTGPRTPAGKFHSSQNALKHGRYCGKSASYSSALNSRIEELGEDPAEFAQIEDSLRTSFLPSNGAEGMLVHEIALLEWQRERLQRGLDALLARRMRKLEIERERQSLMVSQKISSQIPTAQLTIGLLWEQQETPTKYQKLREFLEGLQGCIEVKNYDTAEAIVGWIYGEVPTVRGALIRQMFRRLAAAPADAPQDESTVSTLRLEILREVANITALYQLYLREHTELTPMMLEECLAPNSKQCAVLTQISIIERRIDQKVRLLLHLQKAAADRRRAEERDDESHKHETREKGGNEAQKITTHSSQTAQNKETLEEQNQKQNHF